MKRISIISPAYNEEDNVEACYQAVADLFAAGGPLENYEREHIFADNASEDRTAELLRGLAPASR
jgi:glycosyltransferase involved in cell wall biosynthesis